MMHAERQSRDRLMFGGLLALAVAFLYLAFGASRAAAEPQPEWWQHLSESDQHAIVDYYYESSPQTTVPYTEESAVKEAERITETAAAEEKTAPYYGDFASGSTSTLEDTGLIPELTSYIPEIGAAASAFSAGWLIGEGVNALFLHIGLPEGTATGELYNGDFCYTQECSGELHYYAHGTGVFFGSTIQQSPGAYLFSGRRNGSYWDRIYWDESPCPFTGFSFPTVAHLQTGDLSTATCRVGGKDEPVYVEYPYVMPNDLLREDTLHPYNKEIDGKPTVTTAAPANPGTKTVEERLAESTNENEFTQQWIEWANEPSHDPEEDPAKVGPARPVEEEKGVCFPGGSYTTFDPGAVPKEYEGNPEAAVVHTFSSIKSPLTGKEVTPKLYWGNGLGGFGYRHIAMKHGWDLLDQEETELALTAPDAVVINGTRTTARQYFKYYLGSDEKTECFRKVVVEFGLDPKEIWPTPEKPSPKFIITSYAGVKEAGMPEEGTFE